MTQAHQTSVSRIRFLDSVQLTSCHRFRDGAKSGNALSRWQYQPFLSRPQPLFPGVCDYLRRIRVTLQEIYTSR